jgi:hypothetical protein
MYMEYFLLWICAGVNLGWLSYDTPPLAPPELIFF